MWISIIINKLNGTVQLPVVLRANRRAFWCVNGVNRGSNININIINNSSNSINNKKRNNTPNNKLHRQPSDSMPSWCNEQTHFSITVMWVQLMLRDNKSPKCQTIGAHNCKTCPSNHTRAYTHTAKERDSDTYDQKQQLQSTVQSIALSHASQKPTA